MNLLPKKYKVSGGYDFVRGWKSNNFSVSYMMAKDPLPHASDIALLYVGQDFPI